MHISFTKGSRVKIIADCPFTDSLGIVIYSNPDNQEATVMLDQVIDGERTVPVEYKEIEFTISSEIIVRSWDE
jgi:transcription antitermination factor NusG